MMPASHPPLVSVIIIFLNAERFIGEAIDSVLCQTYAHWELLLVDDGSTDASTAAARRLAETDPDRVRYLEHPGHANRGMAASRNLGIREAAGELVAFLDSDDVWMPEKIQQQVAIMLANPKVGMVCGSTKYWVSWSDNDATHDRVVPTGGPQDQVSYPPSLLLQLYPLGKGVSPCPSDLLLRREILIQVQGFEEQFIGSYQLYEDQAFLTKVYLVAPVYISSTTCLQYRQHSDSCVAKVTREGRHHAVRQYFLEWLARYLADQRIADEAILDALQRARRSYRYRTLLWARTKRLLIRPAFRRFAAILKRTEVHGGPYTS